jgi:hypothetical protein
MPLCALGWTETRTKTRPGASGVYSGVHTPERFVAGSGGTDDIIPASVFMVFLQEACVKGLTAGARKESSFGTARGGRK